MTFPFDLSKYPNAVEQIIASTQVIIDKESAKHRMKLLNMLKAAPGQHNRALITHFLIVKGWISDRQTPDDWPNKFMPNTIKEIMLLSNEIDEFSRRQAKESTERTEGVTP